MFETRLGTMRVALVACGLQSLDRVSQRGALVR
jgi:hypothetical protein